MQAPEPLVLADVVREIQALAGAAERSDRPDLVEASRRVQSMITRLRNQLVEELVREGAPLEPAA